jgi:hypothetical protein
MTNITLPNNLGALDLAAVDIIRDRERGVPRYAVCLDDYLTLSFVHIYVSH